MGARPAADDPLDAERALAADSLERSRRRRQQQRRRRSSDRLLLLAVFAAAAGLAVAESSVTVSLPGVDEPEGESSAPAGRFGAPLPPAADGAPPTALGVRRAWGFADSQPGLVSAAVIDSRGRLRAIRGRRLFVSASMVKGVMLVAYLREIHSAGAELDSEAEVLLEQMITYSDNDSADAIYSRLGDAPIEAAARRAGARTLDVRGYWAETYLSALDAVRFIRSVPATVPATHRAFALRLLAGIEPNQRWGVPEGAGPKWRVWFKGGWRSTGLGALTHQMALLRRPGQRIAIAVLTDGMPSMDAGIETIEGITRRLLAPLDS
jgi:beta-lactamase class A